MIIKNIFEFFRPKPKKTDIENLENAMRVVYNEMKRLEKPFSFPEDCCPSCACGWEWNNLSKKMLRQAVMLRELYKRKGRIENVSRLEFQFGKQELDRVKFGKK